MAKTYFYNPCDHFGNFYLTLTDLPLATSVSPGLVLLNTNADSNIVYTKPQTDLAINNALSFYINSIVKSAGSSSGLTITKNGTVVTIDIKAASTTQIGLVQLNNTYTSTSTTLGATANAVKLVADIALAAAPQSSTYTKTETDNKFVTLTAFNILNTTVSNLQTNKLETITSNNIDPTDLPLKITGSGSSRNITAYLNTAFSSGPLIDSSSNQRSISDFLVNDFIKKRVFNNEINFTSADVTGTTYGIKGSYEFTWVPPTGSTKTSPPCILQIILSDNNPILVPITYNRVLKKVTIKFFEVSDNVSLVYGGVFNTSSNTHTLVLSQTISK